MHHIRTSGYLNNIIQVIYLIILFLLAAFTGWETQNKYEIMNTMGQKIYTAKEGESDEIFHTINKLQWKPVKVNNRLTSTAYVGPVFSALYFSNLNPDNVNHLRP